MVREIKHQTQTRGVCTLSTRQLAELTGIARKTVARSLGRLAAEGRIVKTRKSRGSHPAHWKATDHHPEPGARMTPRRNDGTGTADVFRRRDLQGPGALYAELPDAGVFTATQALGLTALTDRLRTVEWWLLVLGSQLWPLVEEIPGRDRPALWAKNHLLRWQLQENAEHLIQLAQAQGRAPVKPRRKMELQHQVERATPARMFPSRRQAVAA